MDTYTRIELTNEHKRTIVALAQTLIYKKTVKEILGIVSGLLFENMRLAAEVNEHRAARGFELLPIHKLDA